MLAQRFPMGYLEKLGVGQPDSQCCVFFSNNTAATEVQNGYGFGMLPGYGPRDGQFSSLVLHGSPGFKLFIALELGNCPSQGPCLICSGMNPTFYSQMSTPDHPLDQIA